LTFRQRPRGDLDFYELSASPPPPALPFSDGLSTWLFPFLRRARLCRPSFRPPAMSNFLEFYSMECCEFSFPVRTINSDDPPYFFFARFLVRHRTRSPFSVVGGTRVPLLFASFLFPEQWGRSGREPFRLGPEPTLFL